MIYSFGAFDLDTNVFELRRAGAPVAMEPQVFSVLTYLIEHRDRVVTKNELLDNVWGDRFVSESALTTRIKAARRAVGDDGAQQGVIKTVHGRGYRFVAAVRDNGTSAAQGRRTPVESPDGLVQRSLASAWPMIGRGHELEVLAGWFRDRAAGGMLLTGGAGVGKTRLAERVLELAEAAGMPNARVSGHPEGRSIPFAALSHLLPIDVASPTGADDLDRGAVFHRAAAALRDHAGDERLLLLVDDGDQLDELSRALVASLVHSRGVFAVVTMRTTGGPTPFDHLVKDGHLLRLTVEPLPVESIETLLHRVLGGPIVAESLGRLRDAAMGNPGVLRQLVETARESGVLTELNGVWRLVGPLQPTASFEDLVAERLRGLDDAHHHAAELLAIAGEIGLDTLAAVVGHDVLEDLERHGLLTVRYSGRRVGVSLAHPLFAEVLLRQLPALRGRRLRRELAEALEAVGARRRDDRIRLVAWRLDAGGAVDREDVLHAARLALLEGDDAIAERLVRCAEAAGGGARAMELLAELHFRRNEPGRLEAVLSAIDLHELPEPDRVRVVRRRSSNFFYAMTDVDGALAVLDETAHLFERAVGGARPLRPPGHDPLDGGAHQRRPQLLRTTPGHRRPPASFRGPPRPVPRAGGGRARRGSARARRRGVRHPRSLRPRPDPTRALDPAVQPHLRPHRARPARRGARRRGDGRGRRGHRRPRVVARVRSTPRRGARRRRRGRARPERAVRARVPRPWRVRCRALGAVARRHGAAAERRRRRRLPRSRSSGRALARGGLRRSVPQRSRPGASAGWRWSDRVRPSPTRCSSAVRRSRRSEAPMRSRRCCGTTSSGSAALSLVVDRLVELTSSVQGPLIAARADHAVGVVAVDHSRLRSAVAGFEQAGSPLLAAEAALDLADAAATTGDEAGADAARDHARHLLARLAQPVIDASTQSARLKRPASAPSSIASAISAYMRRQDSSAPDVQPSPITAPIAAIRASPTKA